MVPRVLKFCLITGIQSIIVSFKNFLMFSSDKILSAFIFASSAQSVSSDLSDLEDLEDPEDSSFNSEYKLSSSSNVFSPVISKISFEMSE